MEETRIGMGEAARSYADEAVKVVDGAPGLIEATIIPIKELVMNYENVIDQFRDNLKDIQDASRLLLRVIGQHVRVDPAQLTIDYATPVAEADARLLRFCDRARDLVDWDDIKQSTIDRCRRKMAELGVAKCEELEQKCAAAVHDKYREWSGKGVLERATTDAENVAWLSRGAA